MHWLNTIKVRTKLIGGFLIVAGIAALIGLLGVRSASELHDITETMYDRDIVGLRLAANTNIQLLSAERAMRNAMLAPTMAIRQQHMKAMPEYMANSRNDLAQLDPSFTTNEGRTLLQDARNAFEEYEKSLSRVAAVVAIEALGDTERSMSMLIGEVRPIANKVSDLINTLLQLKLDAAHELDTHADAEYKNIRLLLIILTIAGAVLAIIIGALITRILTRQLGGEPLEVANIAHSIADGNLNTKIDAARAPKGSVVDAMSQMQVALRQVVAAVRSSSDSIATGSNQIAIGNADLSQRTEEQAANITETAAAMEELSSTVKSNAEVARQAAQLSSSASSAAVEGGEVVGKVVTTMDEMNESSKKIVEIIDVIDGIAFQTNILALNAAVEAARAGEQGRGFAVVASEVRSLAQRSASAARDIKNLIDDSVNKVENGTKMVYAAGESMRGIVTQVKHVTDLINDISAATTEQTTGLSQISDAVVQLSDVTQQNAALVEESATAAESLSEQAQHLVDVVRVFQIGTEVQQAAPTRTARATKPMRTFTPKAPAPVAASPAKSRLPLASAATSTKTPASNNVNDDWEEF
ncbi:MCP four helix bundle domain-containing protein [Alcaligenaceae bacterium]|nr:MCP four helix bundle domain-containing protein [Alcaligenaceae bacterium]